MHRATAEMIVMISKTKLQTALYSTVSVAAESLFQTGDEVLIYFEKPIKRGIGP